ncbi:MAG: 50S ribosomal protein L32, partial [Desulfobulbaceae bacterium]|nr:50S ribosomal protein L32 [Desulfobulbaceae bacterium]
MALPKRRHSRSRTRKRRSHDFLTRPSVGQCPECGEPKMPHQLCGG